MGHFSKPLPANAYRVSRHEGYWRVFGPDGQTVGGQHTTREAADAACANAQARAGRRPRACLCCGVTFQSEGAHNRMCNPCRQRGDEAGLPNSFSFSGATGRRLSK
jgi:hypothetical protein